VDSKIRQVSDASGFPLAENRADSLKCQSKTLSLNFARSDSFLVSILASSLMGEPVLQF
jgi:hypothetical protein